MAHLVTASRDKTVRLWDTNTFKEIGPRVRHDDAVFKAIVSSDGTKVLSASWDHAAYVWNARAWDLPGEALSVDERGRLAEFTDDRQQIFIATSNGHAGVWSLPERRFLTSVVGHDAGLVTAAKSPANGVCRPTV